MRFGSFLVVAGLTLCGMAGAAVAQTPLYIPMTSQQGYGTTQSGNVPVYNNLGSPLPMDQMIAGKNAPSYNYNAPKPYNLNPTTYGNGVLTADQVARARAERNARAQQYAQEYMQQATESQYGQQAQQAMGGVANAYGNYMEPQQTQKPKKKRLVYREQDEILQTPPRLFNID